jgi:hypothetical protein
LSVNSDGALVFTPITTLSTSGRNLLFSVDGTGFNAVQGANYRVTFMASVSAGTGALAVGGNNTSAQTAALTAVPVRVTHEWTQEGTNPLRINSQSTALNTGIIISGLRIETAIGCFDVAPVCARCGVFPCVCEEVTTTTPPTESTTAPTEIGSTTEGTSAEVTTSPIEVTTDTLSETTTPAESGSTTEGTPPEATFTPPETTFTPPETTTPAESGHTTVDTSTTAESGHTTEGTSTSEQQCTCVLMENPCGQCSACGTVYRCGICEHCVSVTTPAESEHEPNVTPVYTVNDALEILKYIVGLPSIYDHSGKSPTADDALEILKFVAGLPNKLS